MRVRLLAIASLMASALVLPATASRMVGAPSAVSSSDRAVIVSQFAEYWSMSPAQTEEVLAETRFLYDFMIANSDNAEFGAIWATYDPYQVHVRLTTTPGDFGGCIAETVPASAPDQDTASTGTEPAASSAPPSTDITTVAPNPETTTPIATTSQPAAESTAPTTSLTAPAASTEPVDGEPLGFRGRTVPPGTADLECPTVIASDATLAAIAALEHDLASSVEIHHGGASYRQLATAVDVAHRDRQPIRVDSKAGTLHLYNGARPEHFASLMNETFINQLGVSAPTGTDETIQAGDATTSCTVGFTFNGPLGQGFVTAGHCPDTESVEGETVSVISSYQSCDPDYQAMGPIVDIGSDLNVNPSGTHSIDNLATGFYPTQPSILYRRTAAPSVGEILDWDSATPSGGECDGITTVGIGYTNASAPGDSGGPLAVEWGGMNLLLGIHKGTYASKIGMYQGYVRPAGITPCSSVNVC